MVRGMEESMFDLNINLVPVVRSEIVKTSRAWWIPIVDESNFWQKALVDLATQELNASFFFAGPNHLIWIRTTLGGKPIGNAIPMTSLLDDNDCQFYVPCGSQIKPSVPPSLIRDSIPEDGIHVWLPQAGFIRFSPSDGCYAADLFSLPKQQKSQWRSPPSLTVQIPKIQNLALKLPADLASIFGETDIGSEDDLNKLDTNQGGVANAKNWALRQLRKLDHTYGHENPDDRSQKKKPATNALRRLFGVAVSPLLLKQRTEQIENLIEMLKTDPDKALKYAIPLHQDQNFRGFANPGGKLIARNADFSIGGLRGGGAVDSWGISHQHQIRLNNQYRDQAAREAAAGRYRRAAYIAANLLGDFRAAATYLEEGGQYLEAAVLYEKKLNDTRQQARCLEKAGQWEQAARSYLKISDFVPAGEVYLRASQFEQAENTFRSAVQDKIARQQILDAAKLMDERLDERQAAIQLLLNQWPSGQEPIKSVAQVFTWLAEDGNHEFAKGTIRSVQDSAGDANMLGLGMVTKDIANRYPDHEIKALAEDTCRLSLVKNIEDAPTAERKERTGLLQQLDSQDRQLGRDAQRFFARLRKEKETSASKAPPFPKGKLSLLYQSQLTDIGTEVVFARRFKNSIQAIAKGGKNAIHLIADVDDLDANITENSVIKTQDIGLCEFSCGTIDQPWIFVDGLEPGNEDLSSKTPVVWLSSSAFKGAPQVSVNKDRMAMGATLTPSGDLEMFAGRIPLRHSRTPQFFTNVKSKVTPIEMTGSMTEGALSTISDGENFYLHGFGSIHALSPHGDVGELLWSSSTKNIYQWDTSVPYTRKRVALVDDEGLKICWLGSIGSGDSELVAEGAFSFLRLLHGGVLIAIQENRVHAWKSGRHGYKPIASCEMLNSNDARVKAILRKGVNSFQVVFSDGLVSTFQIQS